MEYTNNKEEKRKGEEEDSAESHGTFYICRGGCGAKLTEEEYEQNQTKRCGDPNCPYHGRPFERIEIPQEEY